MVIAVTDRGVDYVQVAQVIANCNAAQPYPIPVLMPQLAARCSGGSGWP